MQKKFREKCILMFLASVVSDHNLRMDSGLTLKLNPDIVSRAIC